MKSRKEINQEKDRLAKLKKKHRAQFFANLKTVCNLFAGYDLYSKIPSAFIERVYKGRMRQFEVVCDKTVFTSDEIKELRELVHTGVTTTWLDSPHGPINLGLMLVEGQSLMVRTHLLKDDEFPMVAEIREGLKTASSDEFQALFNNKANEVSHIVGVLSTSIDRAFVICKMTYEPVHTKAALHYQFSIEKINCITETFVVDGVHARHTV